MDLVSHVAKEHIEDGAQNVECQSRPKSDRESNDSSFVFSKSMLDEYIQVIGIGKENCELVKHTRKFT